jgi:hypothetical protein
VRFRTLEGRGSALFALLLLRCTVLYCTLLHSILMYCTALYRTVLYYTVLYRTVLHNAATDSACRIMLPPFLPSLPFLALPCLPFRVHSVVRGHNSGNNDTDSEQSVNLEGHFQEKREKGQAETGTPARTSVSVDDVLSSSECTSNGRGGRRGMEEDQASSAPSSGGSLEISFHIKEAWNIFEVRKGMGRVGMEFKCAALHCTARPTES